MSRTKVDWRVRASGVPTNQAAIRTYTGLGFRSIMVDVMYAKTG